MEQHGVCPHVAEEYVPLRVLVVSNFFPPHTVGGAEIVAYRQARALLARGHKVTILAGAESSETRPEGFLNFDKYRDLPVYRLCIRSLNPDQNFYWPAAARRLRSIIAANHIDVVHVHNAMGLGANIIPAAVDAGARCLVTLHDHWGFCLRATRLRKNGAVCCNFEECAQCLDSVRLSNAVAVPTRLRRDYVAWCLGQAHRLITPSKYMAGVYESAGFPADSLTAISNGIDLEAIPVDTNKLSEDGGVRFLCSAYLGEHKGILVLLEALRLLSQDRTLSSRWHMTIAGDGHLRDKVEEKLRSAGLSENVTMTGRIPRSDLLTLLSQTNVAVLPSIWPENEPVSMVEAIAAGKAQIATRAGGTPELVDDGQSGFLIAPGDPSELASAMRAYIDAPSLAAMHGDYNFKRRNRFDERRAIESLEVVFESTVSQFCKHGTGGPVIICSTGCPPPAAKALIDGAHDHLGDGPQPRFIWRDWADTSVWREAKLLWLWDRHPEEGLASIALRQGVPVLAPRSDWTEGLARHYGVVILYNTYIEALAAMRALLTVPALFNKFASLSRGASSAATVLAPNAAFDLRSERSDN